MINYFFLSNEKMRWSVIQKVGAANKEFVNCEREIPGITRQKPKPIDVRGHYALTRS
jgi:hypothetical protein